MFFLGRCYKVTSSKSLGQALESLAQKVQCGVVINFEKIGGASNPPPPPPEGRVRVFDLLKIEKSKQYLKLNTCRLLSSLPTQIFSAFRRRRQPTKIVLATLFSSLRKVC